MHDVIRIGRQFDAFKYLDLTTANRVEDCLPIILDLHLQYANQFIYLL